MHKVWPHLPRLEMSSSAVAARHVFGLLPMFRGQTFDLATIRCKKHGMWDCHISAAEASRAPEMPRLINAAAIACWALWVAVMSMVFNTILPNTDTTILNGKNIVSFNPRSLARSGDAASDQCCCYSLLSTLGSSDVNSIQYNITKYRYNDT